MKAKEYLQQLKLLDVKIDQKLKQAGDLRQMAQATGALDYSKDRVQTSPSGDSMSNAVIRYLSLEEEVDRQIDQFVDLKNQIINQIQALKDVNYVQVLFKRYVEYKALEVIAVEMGYTYQYVRILHGHALQDFEKIINTIQH